MKEKTKKNIYTAFIGEAKAYFRLSAYAEKAEEEASFKMRYCFVPLPRQSGFTPPVT